ncbi:MAG: universal stress protein [Rhizobiaceae bacterium]|nr:MAG: universal stress protein [Rhizobiaceae bacterium]CAG1010770.1 hypothetical protein RHIZO_03839 [Rhizobiaceae bacterium]
MGYKSILVNIDIDGPVTPLIKLAADLARQFGARLIGCSAADIIPPMVTMEGMVVDGEMLERQRGDIEARLEHLRGKFAGLVGDGIETDWRSEVMNPTRLLIRTARMADLIVTGAPEGARAGSAYRATDLGDLLLHAGRPVLVSAAGAEHLLARKALVAWKDGREARRAVADAVPFLSKATEVVVATVDPDGSRQSRDSVADVVAWLGKHGIKARGEVLPGRDEGARLAEFAGGLHADLVVSGAYGHSRLREWVLGGVTRSLLDDVRLNRFMSA